MSERLVLVLRKGRERSVLRRHPWIFSGAVARRLGAVEPGDVVTVLSSDGEPLAVAGANPHSQIVARVWSFDPDEEIDAAFLARRVQRAAALRAPLMARTDACRLVFSESDGLPGVVVDRYGSVAVLQLLTAAADRWRDALADAVAALPGVHTVIERSDADGRRREGLAEQRGTLRGPSPTGAVEVWEATPADRDRWVFAVDVAHGHKTGFYLDQRSSRHVVAGLARDRRVLNVFAYTGGFSVAAWWGGARDVVSVDSSGPALALAAENMRRNGLPDGGLVEDDAFAYLRRLRDLGERFDLVVLDPPKLAAGDAQVPKASRAYKDLNLLALKLLEPGGHLVTFSCSGAVSEELFQKIVFGAALDAGGDVQLVQRLGQPDDHPVLLTFPEAAYLKGFVCRVV